ncbi:MAG: hypothetical protein ABEJ04_00100 [Halobacteriaceae archaeon]
MDRRLAALLAALLVATAGCAALTDDAPERVAPGVTADRVVDVAALRAAHLDALRNDSVTVNAVYVQRVKHESYTYRIAHDETARIGADWERFAAVDRVTGHGKGGDFAYTRAVFSNGTAVFTMTRNATGARYERHAAGEFPYGAANVTEAFRLGALEGANVTEAFTDDGARWFRLRSAETTRTAAGNVTSEATALASETGFVKWVDGRSEGVRGPGPTRTQFHVEWVRRGTTTVETPAWVADARNATR